MLHMVRQLSCRAMCDIVTWLDNLESKLEQNYFLWDFNHELIGF